ncbi:MAG: hypothetical protein PHC50_01765 [Candidatus Cloacimonetes bacterium]|nr:hypothetical protein [Candidatus Cloacimonadota bacterium]
MAKATRFMVMREYYPTVIESQVINWIEQTKSIFDKNHIVSFVESKERKVEKRKALEIEQRIGGRYIELILFRLAAFREFQIIFVILKLYVENVRFGKVFIQSRMNIFSLLAPLFKWLPGLILVFEARGTAISEYLYGVQKGINKAGRDKRIRFREKSTLRNAHLSICVSQTQKDFYLKEYNMLKKEKLLVIPGLADEKLFYYDEDLRTRMREELRLKNKTVILYTGRLYRAWQQPDVVFKTFFKIAQEIDNAFFLILTPDESIALEFFKKHGISGSAYLITYSELKGLNSFLNAADYGVLIREDQAINNHASPTKFSEYILSGLRVLISEGVGDYSQFVIDNDCGKVGKLSQGVVNITYADLRVSNDTERRRIASLGKKMLSKQAYIPTIEKAFKKLLSKA